MTDNERLTALQVNFGNKVMLTNGLFHIFDNKHGELYINPETNSLDKRAIYETIVVTDKVIAARVKNSKVPMCVILNKSNFKLLYKTVNEIAYLTPLMLVETKDKSFAQFISHTGKLLTRVQSALSLVDSIYKNMFIVHLQSPYSDKVMYYRERDDTLVDLVGSRRYIVNKQTEDTVQVTFMSGNSYTYNFRTHECINEFTGIKEKVHLWDGIAEEIESSLTDLNKENKRGSQSEKGSKNINTYLPISHITVSTKKEEI